MKIDLHCNLPYASYMPNAALGYIKSFLEQDTKIEVRNIYWDILPQDILHIIDDLTSLMDSIIENNADIYIQTYLTRLLYKETIDQKTPLSALINSPIFQQYDLIELSNKLKKHYHSFIREKGLDKVDIAGFTLKTNQWPLNYYILQQLKQMNPKIITVLGGIQSQTQGLEFMRIFSDADFAIWGEGEIPFLELSKHIDDSIAYKEIPNLIYRKNNETVSTYPIDIKDLPNIDSYPYADHSDYFKMLKDYDLNIETEIPIWGIRSCPWNRCKFCILNEDLYYRERSPHNIIGEIEYQSQEHNIFRFRFLDNDIGRKNKKEFEHFLKLLIISSSKQPQRYHISGDISPFRLNRKTIEMMKKISFIRLQIGFEAMTDSLLQKMKKPHSFAHNIQALKFAEEQDFILTGLNIIRGIPTETKEDVIESIENLKFLKYFLYKYELTPTIFVLFKGAPFYNELDCKISSNWNHNKVWDELKQIDYLSSANKRDFFGFSNDIPNSSLWDTFISILKTYSSKETFYKWTESKDGLSNIEEFGRTIFDEVCSFSLNTIETKILSFCDTIKTYAEIKENFKELEEYQLKEILSQFRKAGLLYFNNDYKRFFISTVSSKYKIKL